MRKYWVVFKVNWQNSVEYRGEFLAHFVRGLISLAVMFFIFKAVFSQTSNFSGYTFSSMFSYLVMTRILHFVTRGNTARQIAEEIKDGKLSIYLIKPISYLRYWFFSFLADRFFEMVIRFSFLLIFIGLFPSFVVFPDFRRIVLFSVSLALALAFNFLFNIFVAFLAFWVTDIRLFSTFVNLIVGFFAGELIPLDALSGGLRKVAFLLPFQYILYFPVKLFQGSLSSQEAALGLASFLIWTLIFGFVVSYLWQKGVRGYEAVGQ